MKKEITVGVAAFDKNGRVLLIQRRDPPVIGLWTLPMGHVNNGEKLEDAAIREVNEETGLLVIIHATLGKFSYEAVELTVFLGSIVSGTLRAGDDAIDAKLENISALSYPQKIDIIPKSDDFWAYHMHQEIMAKLTKLDNKKQQETISHAKI